MKINEKLYKQPRGYLKRAGALVGHDCIHPIPLSANSQVDYGSAADLKEAISKMTAVTGNYLMQLWQSHKNSDGFLVIRKLSTVAAPLGITTQRLKLYLVCLGGYVYPVISLERHGRDRNTLSITQEKLFDMKFIFNLTDSEIEIAEEIRIGTRYLSFIKGKRVSTVRFKPTDVTIKEMEGKGLGNVLVSDSFVAHCLGLSDIAYKLLCYTGSNRPKGKIGFDKIIKPIHLNLEKQLKQQGKPRVLRNIKKGFEELREKGHIKKCRYDEQTGMLEWEYTNWVIKHSDFFRETNNET